METNNFCIIDKSSKWIFKNMQNGELCESWGTVYISNDVTLIRFIRFWNVIIGVRCLNIAIIIEEYHRGSFKYN